MNPEWVVFGKKIEGGWYVIGAAGRNLEKRWLESSSTHAYPNKEDKKSEERVCASVTFPELIPVQVKERPIDPGREVTFYGDRREHFRCSATTEEIAMAEKILANYRSEKTCKRLEQEDADRRQKEKDYQKSLSRREYEDELAKHAAWTSRVEGRACLRDRTPKH